MDTYLERLEDALGLDAVTDVIGEPTEPSFLAVVLVSGLVLGFVLGPARIGMALMLGSTALCWSMVACWPTHYQPFGFLLPSSGFFWCWACKNRLLGPIRTDGGVLTFLPGVIAGWLAAMPNAPMYPTPGRGAFYIAAALLPALNFLVPVVRAAKSWTSFSQLSAKYGKPPPFGTVFLVYCCSQCVFYPIAAVRFGRACGLGASAALLGTGLTAVLAVVAKKAVAVINAPILERQRREHTQAKKESRVAA